MIEKKRISEQTDKFDMCNAAALNECTGLIQVPPQDEYEYDSYREVYDFAPPDPEEDEKEQSEEMYL